MKKYIYYCYLSFQTQLIYRANIWFSIVRAFLFLLIQFFLWQALYAGRTEMMAGYSYEEMLSYQVLSTVIGCFLTEMTPLNTVQSDVDTGNILNYLKLPCSYQMQLFMSSFGKNIFSFLFVSIPILILSPLFTKLSGPVSLQAFGSALFATVLAIGLYFELYYMFGLISFWFMDRYHTMGLLLTNVIRILSGALIPLSFFPDWLNKIVRFLPMHYGFAFPISIYLGKTGMEEAVSSFAMQGVWILILWGINQLLFRIGIKKLILQGG